MQTFRKEERLSNKIILKELIENGKSIYCRPLKLIWIKSSLDLKSPIQLAISVSKKHFKKAVDRNKIKRRIREAYRKNKLPTYDLVGNRKEKFAFLILYTTNVEVPYSEIELGVVQLLQKFNKSNE